MGLRALTSRQPPSLIPSLPTSKQPSVVSLFPSVTPEHIASSRPQGYGVTRKFPKGTIGSGVPQAQKALGIILG